MKTYIIQIALNNIKELDFYSEESFSKLIHVTLDSEDSVHTRPADKIVTPSSILNRGIV